MAWINVPGHIIFVLSFCICIIIGQGIIIFKLLKSDKRNNYGDSDIAKKVEVFKSFWGAFVVYVVATSIIALFIASFISKQNITLNDMNTWVSLILGMVALIIGIISLFLSFYNVDQSVQSQKDSIDIMDSVRRDITEKLNDIDKRVESGFQGLHDDIYRYKEESKPESKNNESRGMWGRF